MKIRLKEIAAKKGITQAALAEKMELSLPSIKKFYISETFTLATLEKLADALECPVWQLIATEYEILQTSEAEAKCPKCKKRIKLKELDFCFDSIL